MYVIQSTLSVKAVSYRVSLAVFAKFNALLCLTQNIARLSRDRIGAEEFEAHVEDVCGQKREEKVQTV